MQAICKQQSIAWFAAFMVLLLQSRPSAAQRPIDADWKGNAALDQVVVASDPSLGAAQGASYRENRLFFYGDVYQAKPRVGIIREYTLDLKPTGRDIQLARNGKPLLVHPTGLTWDVRFGCFLGDTVNKVATIYKLDWQKALEKGNLDSAVLAVIRDDAATNGCRPEFVTLKGRRLLATADYGDVRPAVRLYDPQRLVAAGRSSAPGTAWPQFPADPSIRICPGTRPRASSPACRTSLLGWAGNSTSSTWKRRLTPIANCRPRECGPGSSNRTANWKVGCGCRMAARSL